MNRIAIVLPIRFACRAFLSTGVVDILREEAEILLISPFADSPKFKQKYSRDGIRLAKLVTFQPRGPHARWLSWSKYSLEFVRTNKALNSVRMMRDYRRREKGDRSGYLRRLKSAAYYRWIPRLFSISQRGRTLLSRLERVYFYKSEYSEFRYYMRLFRKFKPDVVVSTSPNRLEEMPIARATEKLGIPHVAYILSFDNIVCYPDYPRLYDYYLVWNERNRDELLRRYPSVSPKQVEVCGPLQFSFYSQKEKYLVSREEWARANQLDPSRPVILYAETGEITGPHEPEVVKDMFYRLQHLDVANTPQILVRLHPMHSEGRWAVVRAEIPEISFQRPTLNPEEGDFHPTENVEWTDEDIAILINTLYHADIHVNCASTMSIDAAYFDKPVIAINYAPHDPVLTRIVNTFYEREHLQDLVASGAVLISKSGEETVKYIKFLLENPGWGRTERKRLLDYYDPFQDGKAPERVANAILRYLQQVVT